MEKPRFHYEFIGPNGEKVQVEASDYTEACELAVEKIGWSGTRLTGNF